AVWLAHAPRRPAVSHRRADRAAPRLDRRGRDRQLTGSCAQRRGLTEGTGRARGIGRAIRRLDERWPAPRIEPVAGPLPVDFLVERGSSSGTHGLSVGPIDAFVDGRSGAGPSALRAREGAMGRARGIVANASPVAGSRGTAWTGKWRQRR